MDSTESPSSSNLSGGTDEVEKIIENALKAVGSVTGRELTRAESLERIGDMLLEEFMKTGSMMSLLGSMRANDQAIELTPPDSPERPRRLKSLSRVLLRRFEFTDSTDHLS